MPASGNYIDLIIILVLIYAAYEAWRVGLWSVLMGFFSFLGSLLISLRIYEDVAKILEGSFTMSHSAANALGFLLSAFLIEGILGYALSFLFAKLPEKRKKFRLSRPLALIPATLEAVILTAFVLTLVLALPINPGIKEDVGNSRLATLIVSQTSGVEARINQIFGGVIEDSLTYFTIKPESTESIPLKIQIKELKEDPESERGMFLLVNQERKKAGVRELTWEESIVPVARKHARDMWERKYFSHYSPEGKDVGDRLREGGIFFTIAGENLALAPTLPTAHSGLMNSEGHRANILEPRFRKMGIGVIDNGLYGKMFVQVFTN